MKVHRINLPSFLVTNLLVVLIFSTSPIVHSEGQSYKQQNLVSDGFISADHNDTNLINAWGVSFNPTGPVWVANNGSSTSTLYDGAGNPLSLIVKIPSSTNPNGGGTPTGIVFNGTTDFVVTKNNLSGASRFIFATEDGVIAGWAPNVDQVNAITVVNNSTLTGAVYKGLAIIAGGSNSLLYTTDFHNNRIDVFDKTFTKVTLPTNAFIDPLLPIGYAPFGLQAINGEIYVSYAKKNQDPNINDETQGLGFGYVNVFDPKGLFIKRIASGGKLNAPWGIALAPAGFGKFSGNLLVGNFGDGKINAYDLATGHPKGQLKNNNGKTITIDGLWGIAFGNGFSNQPVNTLFFAAGPGDEAHGLYGRIDITNTVEVKHNGNRHVENDD